MTDRDTKPQSKETGFRELFVETRPARSRVADVMTPEELDRRCADLPSRGNARMTALEGLVVALGRSQEVPSRPAISTFDMRSAPSGGLAFALFPAPAGADTRSPVVQLRLDQS